jgi:hypothetical protein
MIWSILIKMNSLPTPIQRILNKYDTPQILRGSLYLVWSASILLLIVSISGVIAQRQAIKTVSKDAVPSILIAQQLRDSFADIDASLANELLLKLGDNGQALANFEKNQKKIADRLVAVAKNITYPNEEAIVQTLQLKSSNYFLKLQEARDAYKRGDKVGALIAYRSAASLMDREILPKSVELDRLNSQELENVYDRQSFNNKWLTFSIVSIGLVQICILVVIQIFLYQRMRRIINLPLLVASAIAILFLAYTMNSIVSATSNLKVAKEDAFDSIHSLRQARALSYMANADESRYLLDIANSDRHDRAFKEKIDKIVTIPQGKSLKDVINSSKSLKDLINHIPQSGEKQKFELTGFTGFYAEQLKNITFAGELAGTVDTLNKLDDYLKIDTEIRRLYRSGKVSEAIALCTGIQQGQSNWAFDRYQLANEKTRKINEVVFEQKIEAGTKNLNNLEIIACLSIGSISILTLFGLRPRLAEYL